MDTGDDQVCTADDRHRPRDHHESVRSGRWAGPAEPALNPGLVYNAGWDDWLAFIDGQGLDLDGVDPIDASELNQATIGDRSARWAADGHQNSHECRFRRNLPASVQGLPGVDVDVSPSALSLAEGESASFTVTFTANDTAALDDWSTGSLTWTKGSTGSGAR